MAANDDRRPARRSSFGGVDLMSSITSTATAASTGALGRRWSFTTKDTVPANTYSRTTASRSSSLSSLLSVPDDEELWLEFKTELEARHLKTDLGVQGLLGKFVAEKRQKQQREQNELEQREQQKENNNRRDNLLRRLSSSLIMPSSKAAAEDEYSPEKHQALPGRRGSHNSEVHGTHAMSNNNSNDYNSRQSGDLGRIEEAFLGRSCCSDQISSRGVSSVFDCADEEQLRHSWTCNHAADQAKSSTSDCVEPAGVPKKAPFGLMRDRGSLMRASSSNRDIGNDSKLAPTSSILSRNCSSDGINNYFDQLASHAGCSEPTGSRSRDGGSNHELNRASCILRRNRSRNDIEQVLSSELPSGYLDQLLRHGECLEPTSSGNTKRGDDQQLKSTSSTVKNTLSSLNEVAAQSPKDSPLGCDSMNLNAIKPGSAEESYLSHSWSSHGLENGWHRHSWAGNRTADKSESATLDRVNPNATPKRASFRDRIGLMRDRTFLRPGILGNWNEGNNRRLKQASSIADDSGLGHDKTETQCSKDYSRGQCNMNPKGAAPDATAVVPSQPSCLKPSRLEESPQESPSLSTRRGNDHGQDACAKDLLRLLVSMDGVPSEKGTRQVTSSSSQDSPIIGEKRSISSSDVDAGDEFEAEDVMERLVRQQHALLDPIRMKAGPTSNADVAVPGFAYKPRRKHSGRAGNTVNNTNMLDTVSSEKNIQRLRQGNNAINQLADSTGSAEISHRINAATGSQDQSSTPRPPQVTMHSILPSMNDRNAAALLSTPTKGRSSQTTMSGRSNVLRTMSIGSTGSARDTHRRRVRRISAAGRPSLDGTDTIGGTSSGHVRSNHRKQQSDRANYQDSLARLQHLAKQHRERQRQGQTLDAHNPNNQVIAAVDPRKRPTGCRVVQEKSNKEGSNGRIEPRSNAALEPSSSNDDGTLPAVLVESSRGPCSSSARSTTSTGHLLVEWGDFAGGEEDSDEDENDKSLGSPFEGMDLTCSSREKESSEAAVWPFSLDRKEEEDRFITIYREERESRRLSDITAGSFDGVESIVDGCQAEVEDLPDPDEFQQRMRSLSIKEETGEGEVKEGDEDSLRTSSSGPPSLSQHIQPDNDADHTPSKHSIKPCHEELGDSDCSSPGRSIETILTSVDLAMDLLDQTTSGKAEE